MKYRFEKEQHIHLLDERPLIGTTTALSVLNKPLTWWASGLAVEALGWYNTKQKKDENEIGYKARLLLGAANMRKRFAEVKKLSQKD